MMVLWALFVSVAWAATLDPSHVTRVGRSAASQKFWRPDRLVVIDERTAAVRLETTVEGAPEESRRFAYAYTTDGGQSFVRVDDDEDFCGSAGVVVGDTLICETSRSKLNATAATFDTVVYRFKGGGMFSASTVDKAGGPPHTFSLTGEWDAVDIEPGEVSMRFADLGFHLRNAVVTLQNGTTVHMLFNSMNDATWEEWGVVPYPAGDTVTMARAGAHKLLMSIGHNGTFVELGSPYLGMRWDAPRNTTATVPVHMVTSSYGNVVYTGPQGRPGLVLGLLGKKGRVPKQFDLTAVHNHFVHNGALDASNFSEAYRNATNLTGCTDGSSVSDADGCASSSYIALGALNNDTLLMVYDKLSQGFGTSEVEGADEVFAAVVHLNETAEATRQRQDEERAERLERARRQAQKDEEERVKRARREKLRRDRERRAEFAAMDEVFIANAKSESAAGDIVIVREVDVELIDVEKDTFWDDI